MLKKIVEILINLLPTKKMRRFAKHYIFDEQFREQYWIDKANEKRYKLYEKANNNSFVDYKVPSNTVLIVEPNPYHGEILPGFVKYFNELGFKVDLMLRHENNVDDLFCRFENKPTVFYGTANHLKKMLANPKINDYEYLFLSSSAFWEKEYVNSYLNFLGFEPQAKKGILMIEHNIDPYLKQYNEEQYLQNNRLFTLSGFHDTPMLNPHYFGDKVKVTPKSKDKTRFIVVGGINSACKNHQLLLSSVELMVQKGLDFEVVIVGLGWLKVPENLQNYISFRGRLNFKDMFDEMEKADFFLPLLDASVPEHKRYMTGTTSGSRQLSLGFAKPMVIAQEFAKAYDLNTKNAVVYKNNDLVSAMVEAAEMKAKEYTDMQKELKVLADDIYKKSLNNLKRAVKKCIIL